MDVCCEEEVSLSNAKIPDAISNFNEVEGVSRSVSLIKSRSNGSDHVGFSVASGDLMAR
jgi:hypothetical protein